MKDSSESPDWSAKADLSQWFRWLKRHVLRWRFVLKILLMILRLMAGFDD